MAAEVQLEPADSHVHFHIAQGQLAQIQAGLAGSEMCAEIERHIVVEGQVPLAL